MSDMSPNSSLLEQAVLDAKRLKEAALQQAQSKIIEEHAGAVQDLYKEFLSEAPEDELDLGMDDEMGMGDLGGMGDDLEFEDDLEFVDDKDTVDVDDQVPYSFADGEELCACPDEDEEIEIDFDELMSRPEDMESHEAAAEDMMGGMGDMDLGMDDEIELDDEMLEALVSDAEPTKSGWSPRPEEEWEEETDKWDSIENHPEEEDEDRRMEKTDANRVYTRDDQKKLKEGIESLQKLLVKYEQKVEELNEKYQKEQEMNRILRNRIEESIEMMEVMNEDRIKLTYENKVLGDNSLNERQKRKLVEHISNAPTADAVEHVYTSGLAIISESNQYSPNGNSHGKPTFGDIASANDRVNKNVVLRGSSMERLNESKDSPEDNPFYERMMRNAGIIKD